MREKIAERIFKTNHPGAEWVHTGTIDDSSCGRWEYHCLQQADQILTLICEEIGKSLLTDEETRRAIGKDRKLKSVEDFRQVFADVAQAQIDKILALLQKEAP